MKKMLLPIVLLVTVLGTSCGDNKKEGASESAGTNETAAAPSGIDLFKRNCASCHMANGEGIENVYPPLAKSDYLADKEKTITQVIKGSSGEIVVNGKKYNNTMPPQSLSDEEVAAVLTWVYTLDNGGATVTAEEVKSVRAKQ